MNLHQVQWHLARAAMLMAALCLVLYLYANRNGASTANDGLVVDDVKAVVPALSACDDFNPATVSLDLHGTLNAKAPINGSAVDDFVCSIVKHDMKQTAHLDCPLNISARYDGLRVQPSWGSANPKVKYFFALDLYQAAHILMPLMGAILDTMRFVGPQYCALSIVEGRSTDGTYDILVALERELAAMGVRYFLGTNDLNPKAEGEDRIKDLAILRNQAIAPLVAAGTGKFSPYAADTLIVFVNDIVLCTEDLLELIYQHQQQDAQMTCAFDWNAGGGSFYDSWVSRSMSGNLFFEITHDARYWIGKDMFFDDNSNAERYGRGLPVQVYSCWGGMVTLNAAPFVQKSVTFRSSEPGECYMGEPMTLAKDLWRAGLGKIQAVSSINVAYEYKSAREAKETYKYVHQIIRREKYTRGPELIEWQPEPPPRVKCMPWFNNQYWVDPM
ncbi:hypothetical protein BP00DRAFT_64999 [Aspergillus indologenus CBS 114.80]|uniref:Alpha-1,3-mannosyltransferase CMT1 n=1 Tax=Aspergillus indologenus CBS 114.80 TaxID=1450541 RepID=A0A2V5IE83_9EURO|nr:hypothetical protein BP00DRAFT_64999 [Aspergillus indologenus CBS 114.80]